MTFIQVVLLGHVTIWKIYISTFTRLMVTRLVRVLTSGSKFSTQMLELSTISCCLLKLTEISCFGRCLWIPNNEFHLGVPVLYMVYCSLARYVTVSINAAYKIGCCNWILIQHCTEVDNAMLANPIESCNYHITFVNMLYSMWDLVSIDSWDSSPW